MVDESNQILGKFFLGKQFLEQEGFLKPILDEIHKQMSSISHENVFEWLSLNIYEDLLSIIESFITNELKNKYDLIDLSQGVKENREKFNLIQFEVLRKCINNSKYQIQSLVHQAKLRLMPFKISNWHKLIARIENRMENDILQLKTNFDIYQHQKQSEIVIFEDMVTLETVGRINDIFVQFFQRPTYNVLKYIQAVNLVHEYWKKELIKNISPIVDNLYKVENQKFQKVLNYFVNDIQNSLIKQAIKLKQKNQPLNLVQKKLLDFFKNEKYKNLIYTVIYQSIKNIYLSQYTKFNKNAT